MYTSKGPLPGRSPGGVDAGAHASIDEGFPDSPGSVGDECEAYEGQDKPIKMVECRCRSRSGAQGTVERRNLRAGSPESPDRRSQGDANAYPLKRDLLTAGKPAIKVRSTRWDKVTREAAQRILVEKKSFPREEVKEW